VSAYVSVYEQVANIISVRFNQRMYIIAVVYNYTNVCGTMVVRKLGIFIRLNHNNTDKDSTPGQDENSDKMGLRTRARIYK